ncbi:uncharacterized protein J7T54_000280 [Emericellopsis cladophorae]|uniref:RAD50-interacting protein 1 n=1 Tax=Emericellopsis cladophorae TaxID=2686198 RepID=A0A9P9XYC7_9HYPO|nr:uncharacterized protein J7T54_000280 [Emericellopsis cladophorae]KAI6779980.1 hypothetical protein J7T54_000280 [Emericellopsis cladophorae]
MASSFVQGTSLDTRVEDYLNDKLQSTTDLESLDELLANVELQRNQLQTQLDDAVRQLDEARRTAGDRQGAIQSQIEEFQQLQESIDRRGAITAASDAPDQAIARLQRPMEKLRAVDLAQKYLSLVQEVENLRSEARSHLPESPKAALEPYTKLKQLATRLKELQGDEALHLVDYVEGVTDRLWKEMKAIMSEEFETVLRARKWPKVDPKSQMDDEWIASFEKLIDLQMPEVLYSTQSVSLLPLDVMAKIFIAEFRFHFLGDKPTSDAQAVGTHCFPWVTMTLEKWEEFLRDNLGHLLVAKFRETDAENNLLYVDPVCAFITSLLPVIREKVYDIANKAISNASFFSNFISQVSSFDENLRTRFNYDGGDDVRGWQGLTTEILDEHFDSWFKAERNFAMKRFNDILESANDRKIDYDYAADGRMKPTFAAVRVTDLLRSVTSQYSRLRKVRHKIQFLINIQIDILEEYDAVLRDSLEAYLSITSTFGRTLHGASKEQLAALEGTGGLERLCKVLGSADHIANTLKDWSSEEFFLELWERLQGGPQPGGQNKAGSMTFDEVKDRTSSAMGMSEDGALFDEMIVAYSLRRKTAHEFIVSTLNTAHTKAFRTYGQRASFTTIGESSVVEDPASLNVSPELDEPLHILTRNLAFLAKPLSTASFRRVWREALGKLQDQLLNDILLRQEFTTYGAAQYLRDVAEVLDVVNRFIPGGSSALATLQDGLRLLNLPVEGGKEKAINLKTASDRVFTDNDEARKVLEELELG